MRDGKTAKLTAASTDEMTRFLETETAKVVVVLGDSIGEECELNRASVVLGRGPSVDWVVNDSAISRQHAAIEFTGDGFRVRDLGSTNGILFGGKRVQVAELSNGDRFRLGGQEFQLVIEQREPTAEVFELTAEA